MIRAFLARMNHRERMLAGIVVATVFLLLNLAIWSWLLGAVRKAHTEYAARKNVRLAQTILLKERDLWTKRAQWLKQHQPALNSPAEASLLLDRIKQAAGKYGIQIENPAIGTGDVGATYQSVYASIETKSPWPPLVHFLYDLQQPDAFIVFENVSLAIDSGDPTTMRGKFKIARWYAPPHAK